MEIFKKLNKKGYKHYYSGTIEELDNMDKDNPDLHSEIMQVIMWLYEKHGIWIEVYYDSSKKEFYTVWDGVEYKFNSPTEAYEAVIEYCLKQ